MAQLSDETRRRLWAEYQSDISGTRGIRWSE